MVTGSVPKYNRLLLPILILLVEHLVQVNEEQAHGFCVCVRLGHAHVDLSISVNGSHQRYSWANQRVWQAVGGVLVVPASSTVVRGIKPTFIYCQESRVMRHQRQELQGTLLTRVYAALGVCMNILPYDFGVTHV